MIILKDNEHIFNNKNLCLVPTMGALHEGHIALINAAKKTEQEVIVSVFVNRLQFNDDFDFKNYPRDFEKDISILNRLNICLLYTSPSPRDRYISRMPSSA